MSDTKMMDWDPKFSVDIEEVDVYQQKMFEHIIYQVDSWLIRSPQIHLRNNSLIFFRNAIIAERAARITINPPYNIDNQYNGETLAEGRKGLNRLHRYNSVLSYDQNKLPRF